MAFTDRYIKLPVTISMKENEALGIPQREIGVSDMRFHPLEISTYRHHYDDDGNEDGRVVVELKGRDDNTVINLSMEEFEKRMNEFMK